MNINTYIKGVGALLLALCFAACKKETREVPYPFTQIRSFTVALAGSDSLAVAVDNSALTLYWPGTSALPDSIAPIIKVSERATVSPESGKKVALKDGLTYTVKAQDGTAVTYTFKVINNQAPPQFVDESPLDVYQYTELNLNGLMNYVIPDMSRTKVYLIDGAGKEILLPFINISRAGLTAFADAADANTKLAAGKYKVKVISGDKSVTSATAFVTIIADAYNPPYIYNLGPAAWTAKRGEEITLPVRNLKDRFFNGIYIEGNNVDIIGNSADGQGVRVKIPADFPVGSYYYIETYTQGSGAEEYYSSYLYSAAPLTITN